MYGALTVSLFSDSEHFFALRSYSYADNDTIGH
jgi:hypothetical protein